MKIENVEVYGWRAALRGMRNPMESWAKSDSRFEDDSDRWTLNDYGIKSSEKPAIGPDDMKLALSLIRGGGAHRKFLRQIQVWWDITIPRAIWQELDTYKVSTVRNSCSTMHKLGSRDLERSDFEGGCITQAQLEYVNGLGAMYRSDKTPERLHLLKMHLPESFLQKATYSFNYETALKMYFDRRSHRMPEWSGPEGVCAWILRLPYMTEFANAMTVAGARG
ncbi:MAG: hypothetical protein WC683_02605 [bacterium]